MSGIAKTNAARLLDGLGIAYSLHNAPVDVHDLSAVTMAHSLHVSEDIVFKTLVLRGDKNGVLMACIPAAAELDLKKLAAATGNKQVHMVLLKEVQGLTGYIRGGCSPLAAKKNYPVTIDETALLYEHIYISAGQRGVQLCLAPDDLIAATQGQYADILR